MYWHSKGRTLGSLWFSGMLRHSVLLTVKFYVKWTLLRLKNSPNLHLKTNNVRASVVSSSVLNYGYCYSTALTHIRNNCPVFRLISLLILTFQTDVKNVYVCTCAWGDVSTLSTSGLVSNDWILLFPLLLKIPTWKQTMTAFCDEFKKKRFITFTAGARNNWNKCAYVEVSIGKVNKTRHTDMA